MCQRGFSFVQPLVAMTVMGTMMGLGYPQLRDSLNKEAVRSARREVTTRVAITREVAAQRGCPAVLHVDDLLKSRVWITACSISGTGVDTIGAVEDLAAHFNVTITSTADSIVFTPRGMRPGMSRIDLTFRVAEHSDTLTISPPVGRAEW